MRHISVLQDTVLSRKRREIGSLRRKWLVFSAVLIIGQIVIFLLENFLFVPHGELIILFISLHSFPVMRERAKTRETIEVKIIEE